MIKEVKVKSNSGLQISRRLYCTSTQCSLHHSCKWLLSRSPLWESSLWYSWRVLRRWESLPGSWPSSTCPWLRPAQTWHSTVRQWSTTDRSWLYDRATPLRYHPLYKHYLLILFNEGKLIISMCSILVKTVLGNIYTMGSVLYVLSFLFLFFKACVALKLYNFLNSYSLILFPSNLVNISTLMMILYQKSHYVLVFCRL